MRGFNVKELGRQYVDRAALPRQDAWRFPGVQLERACDRRLTSAPELCQATRAGDAPVGVLLAFRAFAQPTLDAWRSAMRDVLPEHYELTVNERWIDQLVAPLARRSLARDERQLVLTGDAKRLVDALRIDSRLLGYVYLLDREARVRWRAVGAPPADARELLQRVAHEVRSEQ